MLHPAKSKIATKQKSDLLYKAILKLETEEECYNFSRIYVPSPKCAPWSSVLRWLRC